ncbi:DUF5362 domain-containing protein [Metabacillus sp. GX 13764]|uniref:DUF5362 family protein n=1 Tax=Metabacillus kandeliae TaxID=2900151 RepID=UPI001E2968AC|nr:DUF5362 family protein [Metabacillus kandeliae]MCD7032686.1 DUF5362 domain-containing protein [Metabacillus kandeliae]
MLNGKSLDAVSKISAWGKLTGWFMAVTGGLSALTGIFAFVIGAVPGILELIIGIFLIKAAGKAGDLKLDQSENNLSEFLSNLAVYFKIQGILLLVGLVIFLLAAIIWGAFIINLLANSGSM